MIRPDLPRDNQVLAFPSRTAEPTLEQRFETARRDIRASLDLAWERSVERGSETSFVLMIEGFAANLAAAIQRKEI